MKPVTTATGELASYTFVHRAGRPKIAAVQSPQEVAFGNPCRIRPGAEKLGFLVLVALFAELRGLRASQASSGI
jgi:hypothetical protein